MTSPFLRLRTLRCSMYLQVILIFVSTIMLRQVKEAGNFLSAAF